MEDEGSSEDDERLEVVVPGDPVEGSVKVLSMNNEPPGYSEAHLRTQLRMEKGRPSRRHPRPPGTPVPLQCKSTPSLSQPVQRVRPLQLV